MILLHLSHPAVHTTILISSSSSSLTTTFSFTLRTLRLLVMSARPKNTIYIGGIPPQCDESTVHSYFQPFGEIMEVQLPKSHQQVGSNRGFGFVMYATDDEAESAIDNMHLNELEGVSRKICKDLITWRGPTYCALAYDGL
jgi:hypothetical protein